MKQEENTPCIVCRLPVGNDYVTHNGEIGSYHNKCKPMNQHNNQREEAGYQVMKK